RRQPFHAGIDRSSSASYSAPGPCRQETRRNPSMKKADIAQFFDRLAAANPAPVTELEFVNPFTLLVAVVLSAQATDVGVNKATRGLFTAADTPEKMAALGEEGIRQHIRTIGLFNAKAK